MSKIYNEEKVEPQYISISSLEDLKIEGLCQIRGGIIKEGDYGSWNSIKCTKIKIKEGKYGKSWFIDLNNLIERLKKNDIPFRSYKTSVKLLSELKKLYPQHFKEDESTTKKRKDRDEDLNNIQKKIKLNDNIKNEKENLFIK